LDDYWYSFPQFIVDVFRMIVGAKR